MARTRITIGSTSANSLCRVPKVLTVQLVREAPKDPKALLAPKDLKVNKERRVFKAPRAREDLKVYRDPKVYKDRKVFKDHRVNLALILTYSLIRTLQSIKEVRVNTIRQVTQLIDGHSMQERHLP